MEYIFKYIRRNRELFLNLINGLSIEQLNKIPEGFNNNIIWNYGHAIISTEALCYLRSSAQPNKEIPFLDKYKKGSKPESYISQEEIDTLKTLSKSSLYKIEEDIVKGVFENIIPYSTETYGFEMGSIEEIITCCLAHEALHWGYAMAQRRLVM